MNRARQPRGWLLFAAKCTVDNGIYQSSDSVPITLTVNGKSPPRILSLPERTKFCVGERYLYNDSNRPAARGTPPFLWTLGKVVADQLVGAPAGFTLDPQSGIMQWSIESSGSYPIILHATNDVGSDSQEFEIDVTDCDGKIEQPPILIAPEGCGCNTASNGLWVLVLLATFRRRNVRRH